MLHQVRHGMLAVADPFLEHDAYQGDGLDLVQPHAARQAPLRKRAYLDQLQLVPLARK